MNKKEIQIFIEEMGHLGDDWNKEDVERCYGKDTLGEALQSRRSEIAQFDSILGKAIPYLMEEE